MKSALPKVLHEINGRPMLAYVLDEARMLGADRAIVVVGRKWPQVREILDKNISVVYQEAARGTADAVRAALPKIPRDAEDVIVLCGDTPLITAATIRALYEAHKESGVSCTVLSAFQEDPRGYGRILRNESGCFVGIVEDKDASHRERQIKEVNAGMYCFRREALAEALLHVRPSNKSNEFYLTDVYGWLLGRGEKIEACVAEDSLEVLGVNSQGELAEAAAVIRRRVLARFSESGVLIDDPMTTFIDKTARIGRGTRVMPFTYIEKGVFVGSGCLVGPFAHLREGAMLKDGACVGNFAEVKNSTLGEETMMRHVGYLGDTEVGRRVNIGAGCVVANFDGRKKHKTVIKDRAFVGCDAVLVAPVVIGKGAVVGAGAVVTKNQRVPDGATVVGVPAKELKKTKS